MAIQVRSTYDCRMRSARVFSQAKQAKEAFFLLVGTVCITFRFLTRFCSFYYVFLIIAW